MAAGSLVVSGLLAPFGIVIQGILFLFGLFIFIDALVPNGQTHLVMVVFFAIVGGVVSLLGVLFEVAGVWAGVMFVVAALFYVMKLRKHRTERQWAYLREQKK